MVVVDYGCTNIQYRKGMTEFGWILISRAKKSMCNV